MATELHDRIAAMIAEHTSDTGEQGGILISAAHRLDLACSVFTPEEMDDAPDDGVEEAMITAGNNFIATHE